MNLERVLNSVGKAAFVKYYYEFKNKSREECIMLFDEAYTDNAKSTRTGHAQRIFREKKNREALEIIISSKRIDAETQKRAKEILAEEMLLG